MTLRPVPESLSRAGLQPVWAAARRHLDRHGSERRGAISRPSLDSGSVLALESLLGKRLAKRLDLAEVESALVALGVGDNLGEALARIGHPPSSDASSRRVARARSASARTALERAVESWEEPWAVEWAGGVVGAGLLGGLGGGEVESLAADVRRLLDRLDELELRRTIGRGDRKAVGPAPFALPSGSDSIPRPPEPVGVSRTESAAEATGVSRTELAAELFGSSHALDQGTKLASFVSRALRCRLGVGLDGRELWEASGIQADRVSAPALTWAVPATGGSALDETIRAATCGRLPLHISLFAMLRHPVEVPAGTPVLVVENPRLAEAAAERDLPGCVVAANGNPSTAVTTLLRQMQQSGASIWYHGDFDAAGIAICRRMHELGCTPWLMDADDYEAALGLADRNDVHLERDARGCGPTPWDAALQAAFERHRRIVHEEFVLDRVLDELARQAPAQPADVSRPHPSHQAGPSSNPETVPA